MLSQGQTAAAVIFFILLLGALAIGIAALVIATQNKSSSENSAFMARVSATSQAIPTGGAGTIVLFDTLYGTSSGFTYSDGKFTATEAGVYNFVGNLQLNVSGTGGAADPLAPVSVWVSKTNSNLNYAIDNFAPLDNSIVAGNSQYASWSTMLQMSEGESAWVNIVSGVNQIIESGVNTYASIGVPRVDC